MATISKKSWNTLCAGTKPWDLTMLPPLGGQSLSQAEKKQPDQCADPASCQQRPSSANKFPGHRRGYGQPEDALGAGRPLAHWQQLQRSRPG